MTCAVCEYEIERGDPRAFVEGEPVHKQCHFGAEEVCKHCWLVHAKAQKECW